MSGVQISQISKSFGKTEVLRAVSLDVRSGEFISLVGPSGCGKSTLLRIVAGLETQDEGTIRIDGDVVDERRPRDRDLAMVFQSYALYPHLTVRQNMAVPLVMRRLGFGQRLPAIGRLMPGARAARAVVSADVERVADILDIGHLLDRKPGQLSGGQRQRVAVGRAMVRSPRAFLMDEPLSNLDAKLRVHMRAEIAQLHRRLDTTFIYVTHDQAEAMTMSTRIAVMMAGKILQVDEPDEIYRNPLDIRVAEFIGSPKINILGVTAGENGHLVREGRSLPLRVAARSGSALSVGFRPEAAHVVDAANAAVTGSVVHVENLGSERLLHLSLDGGGEAAVVRTDPHGRMPGNGERIGLDLRDGAALAFGESGRRVDLHTMTVEHGGRAA